MKFPDLSQYKDKKIFIPEIKGTASAIHPTALSYDRLSDSLNVFNDNGILKTRNGFLRKDTENLIEYPITTVNEQVFFADFKVNQIKGFDTLGVVVREEIFGNNVLDFFVLDDIGNAKRLFFHEIVSGGGDASFDVLNVHFIKATPVSASGIFVVIPIIRTSHTDGSTTKEIRYFEIKTDFSGLSYTNTSAFYRPLIMKHGRGDRAFENVGNPLKKTVYPEGVNLLNGAFEAAFSTDNISSSFKLPVNIRNNSPITIHFYITDDTYRIFTIPTGGDTSNKITIEETEIYFYVNRSLGIIQSMSNNYLFSLPRYKEYNSLRIFAYTDTNDEPCKIFGHRCRPAIFDGRIFLPSGDSSDNKVYYSGKNEHLYYSEKNSFVIGDNSDNVTAISKQGRYLIAFKEREMYRLTLSETEDISKETVMKDNDISVIPTPNGKIVRINDSIGCDKPATVRFCGNRLVWYHSDGKVYTLYGSNLYTEGSVYELSAEISDRLSALTDEENKEIKAIEISGRYALATRKKIFVMESLVSGFNYLSGHKSADKKYSGLPWFFWETPTGMNLINFYYRKGKSYFIMSSGDNQRFDITSLDGDFDTVYENGREKTEPPKFSFTTAFIGEIGKPVSRIIFGAFSEYFNEVLVYNESDKKYIMPIKNFGKFMHYHMPYDYLLGKVGLKFYGIGKFEMTYLTYLIRD